MVGSAVLHLVNGARLLHPCEQVFEAMLEGRRNQQLARNLAHATVEAAEQKVRAFARHLDAFPWEWTPAMADEWFADLNPVRHLAKSTLRGHQVALRGFCAFITDPAYGWAQVCEELFGTHPVQVLNEVNTAAHVADSEADPAKRAFTRGELQDLFDHADQ